MPYAPSVARGYDSRAATTAALMCLLGRHWSTRAPKIERTDSVPEERRRRRHVGPDAWLAPLEAGRGGDKGKTPQLPRGASVALRGGRSPPERSCWPRGARLHARMAAVASTFFGKSGGAPSAALFYRRCSAFSNRSFVVRAAQRNTRRHSAYTARRDHSKAWASKAAAHRINADICGSALPIARNEETQ